MERRELIAKARSLYHEGNSDDAILLLLRERGEASSSDLRGNLGLELTETRKIAGRLRSLERRGLVTQFYSAFVDRTSWRAR